MSLVFFADCFKRMFCLRFHRPWRKVLFFRWLSVCLLTAAYAQYLVFMSLGALTAALLLLLFAKKCLPDGQGVCHLIQIGLKGLLSQSPASVFVILFSVLIYGSGFYILRYVFLKVLCPFCGNRFFLKGWRSLPACLGFRRVCGWRCANCRIPAGFDFKKSAFKPPVNVTVFLKEKITEGALSLTLIFAFGFFLWRYQF